MTDGLASWLAAFGAVATFFLALWIYGGNSWDRRRAQARLVSAYTYQQQPAMLAQGAFVPATDATAGGGRQIDEKTVKIAYHAASGQGSPARVQVLNACHAFRWEISNLSDELVSDVATFIVTADATIPMSPASPDMPVFAAGTKENCIYVSADPRIQGPMRIRVRFTDAVGRRWERTSGRPLKRLHWWSRLQ